MLFGRGREKIRKFGVAMKQSEKRIWSMYFQRIFNNMLKKVIFARNDLHNSFMSQLRYKVNSFKHSSSSISWNLL